MQEIKKPNFVKNRKLAKTTMFTAIFIFAMLLVSSTAPAANISTRNEIIVANTAPASLSNELSARYSTSVETSSSGAKPFSAVDILTEGFEGGTMPPAGWTHIQYNPVETWETLTVDPHSGIYHADCQYDSTYTDVQDEWLISPSMDFTGYDEVYLSFWWFMSYYWGVSPYDNYDTNVYVSTDSGGNWTLVWNEDSIGTFYSWTYYDATFGTHVDLSAYNTYTDVIIGFQYEGWDGAETGIDDINVYGVIIGADDVGVTSIDAPATGTATGPITPEVTVENFGSAAQTDVPVTMDITAYGTPTYYFCDGFEDVVPGYYDMPTGWTVSTTNPTGTWYTYSSSSTYSASTYPRIQESGSDGNAQDESLISPAIDCSALSTVELRLPYFYFYAYSPDYANATIYVTNDSGTTWNQVVQYTATSTGAKNLDVTTYAAGYSNVQFKFRFESDADATLSSYWYFDYMWVGDPTVGAWGTYGDNPPLGWTIERFDTAAWDANHWYKYSSSSYDMYGSAARIAYASPYPEINDNLTSPSIDCSGMSTVILQFNCYHYAYTSYLNEGYVQISTDGGITWIDVDDYKIVPPGSYGYSIQYEWYNGYDITGFAAGESDLKVRFHFTRPAGKTSGYWYLDNVRVHDGSGSFKFIETFDASTSSLSGSGGCVYFTNFKNYIHDTWGGKWDWKFTRAPYYNNKWWQTTSSSDPVCTPIEGSYMAQHYNCYQGLSAMLYSIIPLDVSAANTLKMSFWMYHDTQVGTPGVLDILASHDGITWNTMGSFLRNDGSANGWYQHVVDLTGYEDDTALQIAFKYTADYVAYMNIDDVCVFDPGLILEYSETVLTDIPARASVQVTFPAWTPDAWHVLEDVSVLYDVYAATELVGDEVPANDGQLALVNLYYPFMHDLSVISIDSPNANGPGQTQEVKATVMNLGQYPERNFFVPVQIGEKIYTTDGYFNNFEANDGGFVSGGTSMWAWGTPTSGPGAAYSGTKLWATVLGGNYIQGHATLDTAAITVPTGGDLSFWHWYDYENAYDGYNVKISTDGGTTWTLIMPLGGYTGTANSANPLYPEPIWTNHVQKYWEYEEFDLAAYEGMSVKFRFDMGADSSVFYPGTYLDDILVGTLTVTIDAEYDESAAVASWLQPGQSIQLTYPDWTPENLGLGVSGDIEYGILGDHTLAADTNAGNDEALAEIVLSFWHDVKIKSITSPADGGRDLLFHQRPFTPTESWTFRTSASTYLCQDDFWDLTAPIGNIEFWGLCLIYSAGWTPGNPNTLPFQVKFYEAGTTPGAVVGTYDLAAITPVNTGQTYSGFTMYYWSYDITPAVPLTAGWMSIQSQTAPDNAWLLWAGSPEGNVNMYQQGASPPQVAGDCAFNLSGTASPVPPVQLYVAPGVQSISSIVANVGTFTEEDLTCYAEVWEYISDPNGTIVYQAQVDNIDLDPFTGEESCAFGSYDFQDPGVYGLFLNIPLTNDDVQNNNIKNLGIGVDDTAPESTHTLTPGAPNGENGWYITDVKVKLEAEDPEVDGIASGVKEIKYKIDAGGWQTYTGEITVSAEGPHTVKYYAVDNVDNTEPENEVTFKIDKSGPEITLSYEVTGGIPLTGYTVVFTATANDEHSGMDKVEFYMQGYIQDTVSGPGPIYQWTITNYNPDLAATFKAIGYDLAGNTAEDIEEDPVSHSNNVVNGVAQPIVKTVKLNLGR